jgi:hypothetical protein
MIMKRSLSPTVCIILVLFMVSVVIAGAQQPKTPEPSAAPATPVPATQAPITRFDRLAVAKTIYIKNNANNEIPYNVISTSVESWGRYIIVDDPDKAEIVMEISMSGEQGVKVTESNKTSMHTGQPGQQDQSQSKKEVSSEPVEIKVIIYDKNKRPMWIAREEPKFAVRHKAEENHIVEASQKLFTRFHDRVEPPLPKQ